MAFAQRRNAPNFHSFIYSPNTLTLFSKSLLVVFVLTVAQTLANNLRIQLKLTHVSSISKRQQPTCS